MGWSKLDTWDVKREVRCANSLCVVGATFCIREGMGGNALGKWGRVESLESVEEMSRWMDDLRTTYKQYLEVEGDPSNIWRTGGGI